MKMLITTKELFGDTDGIGDHRQGMERHAAAIPKGTILTIVGYDEEDAVIAEDSKKLRWLLWHDEYRIVSPLELLAMEA